MQFASNFADAAGYAPKQNTRAAASSFSLLQLLLHAARRRNGNTRKVKWYEAKDKPFSPPFFRGSSPAKELIFQTKVTDTSNLHTDARCWRQFSFLPFFFSLRITRNDAIAVFALI